MKQDFYKDCAKLFVKANLLMYNKVLISYKIQSTNIQSSDCDELEKQTFVLEYTHPL